MSERKIGYAEVGAGTFLVVLSGLVFAETRDIAPPLYDPLGSAAIPQVVALVVAGMAAAVALSGIRRLRVPEADASEPGVVSEAQAATTPEQAMLFVALCAVYLVVMGVGLVPFAWASLVFVTAAGTVLGQRRPAAAAIALLLGVLLGFGGKYVFTHVFFLDLPQ